MDPTFISLPVNHSEWNLWFRQKMNKKISVCVWMDLPLPGSNSAEGSGSLDRRSLSTSWRVYIGAFVSELYEMWCHHSPLWSHLDTHAQRPTVTWRSAATALKITQSRVPPALFKGGAEYENIYLKHTGWAEYTRFQTKPDPVLGEKTPWVILDRLCKIIHFPWCQ